MPAPRSDVTTASEEHTVEQAVLQSIQVGRVRTHAMPRVADDEDAVWQTGYYKDAVAGPVRLGSLGLDGDEQWDRESHGGPDRAALAYAAAHYPAWRAELGIAEMGPGAFAENFTIGVLDESSVCVGDVYRIGPARVQVTQPRGPCSNISRRWQRPTLLKRVAETSRFGWYLRVLEAGMVEAGQVVELLERPYPAWNVAHVFRLRVDPKLDPDAVTRLAVCPELSAGMRAKFEAHRAALAASPQA
jgi:MOSC domain-containing protein YiiM